MQYRQKLDDLERRFEELTQQMADPAVIADAEKLPDRSRSVGARSPADTGMPDFNPSNE